MVSLNVSRQESNNQGQVFEILVDHFQFFLEDCKSRADTSQLWDEEASIRRVDVRDDIIAIGTENFEETVIAVIEIQRGEPVDSLKGWTHVVECSISIHSGCIMLTAPELDITTVPRIAIPPGLYRSRIFFGSTSTAQFEHDKNHKNMFRIVLWKGERVEPVILKQKTSGAYGQTTMT